jgi:glucosamine-6-phosphate deaminase
MPLSHLDVYALDEYVGVPLVEPRTCANLLRRTVAQAWGVGPDRFFAISSRPEDALRSVVTHEHRIEKRGGLDVIILGLGQNGHLGFNEPGSAPDSEARVIDLDPGSTEANRRWFGGDYAPAQGATVGLKTILAARHAIVLAYGASKAAAVRNIVEGQASSQWPASFLRPHPAAHLFVDQAAAAELRGAGVRAG